ncbi:hypothetical protein ACVWVZ_002838 [Pseudomonas tolaasii]
MIGLREDRQMRARMVDYLNFATALCGSGLARDSGVSFNISVSDPLLSRASPLPHGVEAEVKAGVESAASKVAG